MLFCKANS